MAPRLHDAIPVGVLVIGLDLQVIEVNRRALELLQVRRAEIVGHNIIEAPVWQGVDLVREDGSAIRADAGLWDEFLGPRGRGAGSRVVGAIHEGDGEPVWVLVDCRVLGPEEGCDPAAIIVTVIDITAQKRAEVMLEQAAAELHGLLDALPDSSIRLDRDGRIVDYHASEDVVHQVVPDELLGSRPEEVMPAEVATPLRKALAAARLSRQVQSFEALFDRSGERRWVEFRVVPLDGGETIVLGREMTNERLAVQRLALSEERYRAIFNTADVGIIVADRDLRVVDANPRFLADAGVSLDDVLGFDVRKLTEPKVSALFERALDGESAHYAGPYRNSFESGMSVIDVTVEPLRDPAGAVTGVMAVQDRFETMP
jgi:PAS domain S-box-containing protein